MRKGSRVGLDFEMLPPLTVTRVTGAVESSRRCAPTVTRNTLYAVEGD
jgi:hypothetical protein